MAYTHISGHPSATGRAQDSESSPAKDQCSTAGPRNQGHVGHWSTFLVIHELVVILTGDDEDEDIQRCQKTLSTIINDIRHSNARLRHPQTAAAAATADADTTGPQGSHLSRSILGKT